MCDQCLCRLKFISSLFLFLFFLESYTVDLRFHFVTFGFVFEQETCFALRVSSVIGSEVPFDTDALTVPSPRSRQLCVGVPKLSNSHEEGVNGLLGE